MAKRREYKRASDGKFSGSGSVRPGGKKKPASKGKGKKRKAYNPSFSLEARNGNPLNPRLKKNGKAKSSSDKPRPRRPKKVVIKKRKGALTKPKRAVIKRSRKVKSRG